VLLFKKLGINSQQTRDYSDEAHAATLLKEIEDKQTPELFYEATTKKQDRSVVAESV
jgi:biotin synthase